MYLFKFDQILVKMKPIHWLFLIIVHVLISLTIHYYQFPLGSNEVVSTLNHRPNLLNEKVVGLDNICSDCTIQFSKAQGEIESGIYRNKGLQPKLFIQLGSIKIPLLMQNRTGGWPFLSLRLFRDIFGAKWAIFIQSLLLSLAFLFFCYLIFQEKLGEKAYLIIIPAFFFPFISFFFSIWLDSQWSMVAWLAGLAVLSKNRGKSSSLFAGLLIGLGIHFKLASFLFGLPWIWFVFKSGSQKLNRYFLGGLFLILIVHLSIIDFSELYNEIFLQRNLVKSPWFFLYGVFLILLHFINPALIFSQLAQRHNILSLENGEGTWSAVIRVLSETSIVGELIGFFCLFFFLMSFFRAGRKGLYAFLMIGLYFLITLIIARGVTEDLSHYFGYGLILFLFFSFFLSLQGNEKEYNKIFLIFCLYSLSWIGQTSYSVLTKKNYSLYQKLAQRIEKNKKLVFTDHYESIGQIEFYSEGKIWPYHMRGKYGMGLKNEKQYSFLKGNAVLIMMEGPDLMSGLSDFRNKSRAELVSFYKDRGLLVKSWEELDFKEYRRKFLLMEFE